MPLSDTTFLLSEQAQLTPTQQALTKCIATFIKAHQADDQAAVFVLHGDAGSGKSVVLNAVFTAVREPGMHLLVNHNEMLKVYNLDYSPRYLGHEIASGRSESNVWSVANTD